MVNFFKLPDTILRLVDSLCNNHTIALLIHLVARNGLIKNIIDTESKFIFSKCDSFVFELAFSYIYFFFTTM